MNWLNDCQAGFNAAPCCITLAGERFTTVSGFFECLWNVYRIQQVQPPFGNEAVRILIFLLVIGDTME